MKTLENSLKLEAESNINQTINQLQDQISKINQELEPVLKIFRMNNKKPGKLVFKPKL